MPNDLPDWAGDNTYSEAFIATFTPPSDGANTSYPVAIYSTLNLVLVSSSSPCAYKIQFLDYQGTVVSEQYVTSVTPSTQHMSVPVVGATFVATCIIGHATSTLAISGTNRSQPGPKLTFNNYLPRQFGRIGVYTTAAGVPLPSLDALPNYSELNGLLTYSVTSTVGTGVIYMAYALPSGQTTQVPVIRVGTAAAVLTGQIVHPMTQVVWEYLTDANNTSNVVLTLVPSSSDQ